MHSTFVRCRMAATIIVLTATSLISWAVDGTKTPAVAATIPAASATPVAAASAKDAKGATSAVAAYYGKKFSHVPGGGTKMIALTFDDGPYAKTTPRVIEILKREKITATFFMLGQSVQTAPDVAKQVAEAGFELGCHSISHQDLRRKGLDEIKAEIVGSADLVEQATGKRPHVFRPPYGSAGAALYKVCADNGFVVVDWSVDPMDWKPKTSGEAVYATIMRQIHGGAVILMHDTKEKNVAILPKLIADLKAKGFQFVTVSELIAEAAKHPAPAAMGGEAGGGEMGGGDVASARPAGISLKDSAIK